MAEEGESEGNDFEVYISADEPFVRGSVERTLHLALALSPSPSPSA